MQALLVISLKNFRLSNWRKVTVFFAQLEGSWSFTVLRLRAVVFFVIAQGHLDVRNLSFIIIYDVKYLLLALLTISGKPKVNLK